MLFVSRLQLPWQQRGNVALRLRTALLTGLSLQAARTAKQKRTLISAPLSKGNMIRVCLVQDQKQMERCFYVKRTKKKEQVANYFFEILSY